MIVIMLLSIKEELMRTGLIKCSARGLTSFFPLVVLNISNLLSWLEMRNLSGARKMEITWPTLHSVLRREP